MHVYWLIHGPMTSNKQFPSNVYKLATFVKAGSILRSEGNSALLPASAHDQTVTEGGMLIFFFFFFFFLFI